jgi:flagellar hook-basal body complex protein FliE
MAIVPVGTSGLAPVADGVGLPSARPTEQSPFVNVVEKLLGEANAGQLHADQATRDLAAGQVENLHDVMVAVAKADLSFRMILEVRNRLTEAYQEIMRMQV